MGPSGTLIPPPEEVGVSASGLTDEAEAENTVRDLGIDPAKPMGPDDIYNVVGDHNRMDDILSRMECYPELRDRFHDEKDLFARNGVSRLHEILDNHEFYNAIYWDAVQEVIEEKLD